MSVEGHEELGWQDHVTPSANLGQHLRGVGTSSSTEPSASPDTLPSTREPHIVEVKLVKAINDAWKEVR